MATSVPPDLTSKLSQNVNTDFDVNKENKCPYEVPADVPEHLKEAVKEQMEKMWHAGIERRNRPWSLDDFEIGKPIGEGKFGKVYLARDKYAHSFVALKVISKSIILQDYLEHQVLREIENQSRLKHPNILNLYTYFSTENYIFLVLEYVGDGDLFKHLQYAPDGRFPESLTAKYVYQVANALHYCHLNNVIHRDIKPENLLLSINGNIKVADFGVSVHSPSSMRQTVCGTSDYLAPEVVKHKYYDECVDNWSLGVLSYELLVGKPPFENKDRNKTYINICRCKYEFPTYISSGAKDLIDKLLRYKPSERLPLPDVMKHDWIITNIKITENQ